MTDPRSTDFVETVVLQPPAVTRLLEMGLSSFRCWVEVLKDLLRDPDGHLWLERALAAGPVGRRGNATDILIDGRAGEAELRAIKSESKTQFRSAGDDDDERMASLAAYFLTLAAGLAHHGAVLSRQPDDEVIEVLADLTDVFPARWGDLLATGLARAGRGDLRGPEPKATPASAPDESAGGSRDRAGLAETPSA